MKLVYIHKVGKNSDNEYIYEFLFSKNLDNIDGDSWDSNPANNHPEPPNRDLINKVGIFISETKLDLIQESGSFGMWDAVDGLIALGWENISNYDDYPDKRLFFKFGEELETVTDKIYEIKDKVLNFDKSYA